MQRVTAECRDLLRGQRVLLCFGDHLALCAVADAEVFSGGVKAAVTTEEEGVQHALRHRPDLVLASEDLERGYGIRLLQRLKQALPQTRLLIFLRRETQAVVQEAMLAGADGVLFISALGGGSGNFVKALQVTSRGGLFYPGAVRAALRPLGDPPSRLEARDTLSERELEVVSCIAGGYRNSEIAEQLQISTETVKSHISAAIQKLCVRDRTQLAVQALLHGWISAQ